MKGAARVPTLVALLLVCGLAPIRAQDPDEEDLQDRRLQDEQYLRRYLERENKPEAGAVVDETARIQAFLDKADELIRDKNHRSIETDAYRIESDDPRLDLNAAARLLGGFRSFFDSWAGSFPTLPYDQRSRVFLFYSYYKYNQLVEGDWQRQLVRPKGHYGSLFDVVVLHTDSDRPGGLANTLVHEAAHQLVDQRLYGSAARPSLWVSEGLATYFENTFMDASGAFHTGEIGGKQIALLRDGPDAGVSDAKSRLRHLRDAFKRADAQETPLVLTVVAADQPAEFYGRPALSYDVSWLLVHYLLHGDNGAHVEALVRYVELEVGGRGGAEALFSELGTTPEQLNETLRSYVNSLKAR